MATFSRVGRPHAGNSHGYPAPDWPRVLRGDEGDPWHYLLRRYGRWLIFPPCGGVFNGDKRNKKASSYSSSPGRRRHEKQNVLRTDGWWGGGRQIIIIIKGPP